MSVYVGKDVYEREIRALYLAYGDNHGRDSSASNYLVNI